MSPSTPNSFSERDSCLLDATHVRQLVQAAMLVATLPLGCMSTFGVPVHDPSTDTCGNDCKKEAPTVRQCFSDGGLEYARFGGAQCDDPVDTVFVHGALGDAYTWTIFAENLNDDHKRRAIAISLPGHGRSDLGDLNSKEIDPVHMAQEVAPFLISKLSGNPNTTIVSHSTGAAVAALLVAPLHVNHVYALNPTFVMEREAVLPPGNWTPLPAFQFVSDIVQTGFTVNQLKNKNKGPSLLEYANPTYRDFASKTNICINIVDESGAPINNDPCDNASTKRRHRALKGGNVQKLSNAVRYNFRLKLWRDAVRMVLRDPENQQKIHVILNHDDPLLDPELTSDVIRLEYSDMKIKWLPVQAGHESMSTQPKAVAHAIWPHQY